MLNKSFNFNFFSQVEYFENHVDELENSENANEGDFMSNLPDCYRNLFQMSKEVYKDFNAENRSEN